MTNTEYLQGVLKAQDLADDSTELKEIIERRQHVEQLLRAGFKDGAPTIRYGGSKAKGTLIREAYDLDVVCYFPSGNNVAGDSLEEIYNNVAAVLEKEYSVDRKRSSLRLRSAKAVDFHIDVIPGRYTDEDKKDCFLYQKDADKCRLKTNLDVHIAHVHDSGILDALRLLKLWKVRKALPVKQFAFELLVIKLLAESKQKALPEQLNIVWAALRDAGKPLAVEDPANPGGNDLTSLLAEPVWSVLRSAASETLTQIDALGWTSVFGKLESSTGDKRTQVAAAVASVIHPTKPWAV